MEYRQYDFLCLVIGGSLIKYELRRYFKQIFNGVKYSYYHGLEHLQLKIDTFIITNNGILKLIDFGNALIYL